MRHRNRSPRLACALAAAAALLGATATTAETAPLAADGATSPAASVARTVSVNELGQLRLISKHGFTLDERGTASGTIKGTITVQLKIVSSSRVTAEVTIFPKGGSIAGHGTASYHKGEPASSFVGSLAIARGSGSYAHAQGSGLSFSGTIAQANDAIVVHVSGSFSD
jgi:hypothetical protein